MYYSFLSEAATSEMNEKLSRKLARTVFSSCLLLVSVSEDIFCDWSGFIPMSGTLFFVNSVPRWISLGVLKCDQYKNRLDYLHLQPCCKAWKELSV